MEEIIDDDDVDERLRVEHEGDMILVRLELEEHEIDEMASDVATLSTDSLSNRVASMVRRSFDTIRESGMVPIDIETDKEMSLRSYLSKNHLPTIIDWSQLIFFSYVGLAFRIYLIDLYMTTTSKLGSVLFADIYANTFGCLLVGIFAEMSKVFNFHFVRVALITGLCGCMTTFSSWQQDCAAVLIRGSIMQYLWKQVIGFATCYCAILAGHDLGAMLVVPILNFFVEPEKKDDEGTTGPATGYENLKLLFWMLCNYMILVLNIAVTLIAIILLVYRNAHPSTKYVCAALLACPFGCIIRYYFSLLQVRYCSRIPLFTLGANMIGSLIVCFIVSIQSRYSDDLQSNVVRILFFALVTGFCGCLTTVSTVLEEICALTHPQHKYLYYLSTITSTNLVLIVVNACFYWIK